MLLNQWVAEQMVAEASADDRCRAHRRGTDSRSLVRRSGLLPELRARATWSLTRRAGELLITAGSHLLRVDPATGAARGVTPVSRTPSDFAASDAGR
jgi:hypothetical protein